MLFIVFSHFCNHLGLFQNRTREANMGLDSIARPQNRQFPFFAINWLEIENQGLVVVVRAYSSRPPSSERRWQFLVSHYVLSHLKFHDFVPGLILFRIFFSSSQPSHKTFRIKKKLGKKMRQNRPIPHWIRLRTDNTIRSRSKTFSFIFFYLIP